MRAPLSLRRYLLLGILLPVIGLIVLNTVSLYAQALAAVNTAYDRTLLASAKVIGEQLDVEGYDELSRLRATVPYSALEAFEADVLARPALADALARGAAAGPRAGDLHVAGDREASRAEHLGLQQRQGRDEPRLAVGVRRLRGGLGGLLLRCHVSLSCQVWG